MTLEPRPDARVASLTARQWEAAELVALGYSNTEIARELCISVAGAKYLVQELLRRLGASTRSEIAAWYRDERLRQTEQLGVLEAARRRGWPEEAVKRALQLRLPRRRFEAWLRERLTADEIIREIERYERVLLGQLRSRIADADDAERLIDLYRNAPQELGEWELTVDRSPYPFAQLRLQERPWIQVVEEGGVVHAAVANAVYETEVAGRRVSVHFRYAAKVRRSSRGRGFGRLSLWAAPADAPAAFATYYFLRPENVHLLRWLQALAPGAAELQGPEPAGMPGIPVAVDCYPAVGRQPGVGGGIRRARRSDLRACVALINRTHRGLDLFRPYTVEFLERRLNDGYWGPKPAGWVPVYGWADYYVLEEGGRVVACGGLWDRGRDIREVWRHRETGRSWEFAPTALLDFGYAEGREDAMARLLAFFLGETAERSRTHLMAPLSGLPAVREQVRCPDTIQDRRYLVWRLVEGDRSLVDRSLQRPYIDLAYWA